MQKVPLKNWPSGLFLLYEINLMQVICCHGITFVWQFIIWSNNCFGKHLTSKNVLCICMMVFKFGFAHLFLFPFSHELLFYYVYTLLKKKRSCITSIKFPGNKSIHPSIIEINVSLWGRWEKENVKNTSLCWNEMSFTTRKLQMWWITLWSADFSKAWREF